MLSAIAAWILVAVLPAVAHADWGSPLQTLWMLTLEKLPDTAVAILSAYTFVGIAASTISFATHLQKVSFALEIGRIWEKRSSLTFQDWHAAFQGTVLEPLSNRLLSWTIVPNDAPMRTPLSIAALFEPVGARKEIVRLFLRRISLLQVWSVLSLMVLSSALCIIFPPERFAHSYLLVRPWLPVGLTVLLTLMLAAVISFISDRADALVTTISNLAIRHMGFEQLKSLFREINSEAHERSAATERLINDIGRELAALREGTLRLVEIGAAMRAALPDSSFAPARKFFEIAVDATEPDRDQVSYAGASAVAGFTNEIEERTSAVLARSTQVLAVAAQAADTLSTVVTQLRGDWAEQSRLQREHMVASDQHASLALDQQSRIFDCVEAIRDGLTPLLGSIRSALERGTAAAAVGVQPAISPLGAESVATTRTEKVKTWLREEVEALRSEIDALSSESKNHASVPDGQLARDGGA